MTQLLISPAERPPITNLGANSILPEKVGSDIIWEGYAGMAGVQRKELSDLIASVRPAPGEEPRLGKEVKQMTDNLKYAFLVVEGIPQWDREGNLMSQYANWTMKNHNGVLLSVQSTGVMVLTSRNAYDTCLVIEHLVEWTQKAEHVSSLIARPKPPTDGWGRMDDRLTFIHTFSAVPSISTELSARIFDTHGNILTLKVGADELMQVPGLGPKRVASILRTFGVTSNRDRSGDQS